VGFDDQEYIASELDPPLTTMRLPLRDMGHLAVELLLDDAESPHDGAGGWVTRVRCHLVRRESVAPPRTGTGSSGSQENEESRENGASRERRAPRRRRASGQNG